MAAPFRKTSRTRTLAGALHLQLPSLVLLVLQIQPLKPHFPCHALVLLMFLPRNGFTTVSGGGGGNQENRKPFT